MKVIFMGTPDFAVGTLKALHEAGHEVTLVVSQPDKPKGRKQELSPTPVKAAAEQLGLPVYQPSKIRAEESIEYLRNVEADVIVVAAFGQIIPRAILEMKKYGCINVHASLLPRYRGAAPIQWAVINGEKESGVTIMQMDEGLDTGDMLLKETVPLEEKETGGSLFDKLSRVGADLCVKAERTGKRNDCPGKAGRIAHCLCFYADEGDGKDRLDKGCGVHRAAGTGVESLAKRVYKTERKNFENLGVQGCPSGCIKG